jgi:hypothetical protein
MVSPSKDRLKLGNGDVDAKDAIKIHELLKSNKSLNDVHIGCNTLITIAFSLNADSGMTPEKQAALEASVYPNKKLYPL